MKQIILLFMSALLLSGCAGMNAAQKQPTAVSIRPLQARVPTECRIDSKPFIKVRETGTYDPSDLANDFRRARRLYVDETRRADRCRMWARRVHKVCGGDHKCIIIRRRTRE